MKTPSVILDVRDELALVRLNRPEKMNALTREMLERLGAAFARIGRERNLRAAILTGVGAKAFSAGTDISELNALDAEAAWQTSRRGQDTCEAIENCGVPVIAAVGGIAAGGGLELALACHLRVASNSARFSLPETKLGVIPAYGGTQRLARVIGEGRALEMMLTGKNISAEEAARIGLVNRTCEPAQVLDAAETLAHEISRLAPLAIRACLEAVMRGQQLPLVEGLQLEAQLFSRLFATRDVREGTTAFLEKRAPVFEGK